MSMNKMFKKVLAVVAAGAMTMGMAMPTFAADEGKKTEAWITKTYNTEVGKAETPVRILSPGPKSTSTSSISARFFTCKF